MATLSIPVSVAQWRKDSSLLMTQESGKRLSRRLWEACPVSLTTSHSGSDVWSRWQRPLSYTHAVCCVSAGSELVPSFHWLLQVYQTELSWINTNTFASFFPPFVSFFLLSFCCCYGFAFFASCSLSLLFSWFSFSFFAISYSPVSFVSFSFFCFLCFCFFFLLFYCYLFSAFCRPSHPVYLLLLFIFLHPFLSLASFIYLFSVVFLSPSFPFPFFVSFFVWCGVTWRRIHAGKACAKRVSNLVLWNNVFFCPF